MSNPIDRNDKPIDPQVGAHVRYYQPTTDDDTIEWLCIEYHERDFAGEQPNPGDYVRAYPQFARVLVDFFLYFHCFLAS